jgi:hypothetical protein
MDVTDEGADGTVEFVLDGGLSLDVDTAVLAVSGSDGAGDGTGAGSLVESTL